MSRNPAFGTFGRYTELSFPDMSADQKRAYDSAIEMRGQLPGPYKICLQNPRLMAVMLPLGAYYQGHSTLTKAEIEIGTNLINAKWLAAYSNYEHEMIAEKEGGLAAEQVQALIAGLPTSFKDARQQVVYEITSALIEPRVVPTGLYRRGVDLIGDAGLTDLTYRLLHQRFAHAARL